MERQSLTLRQRACDNLRQAIIEHRLPPGSKLVERDLCEQLGVSRTSVREALRHLESEKLIKMVPHKGPVVATLSLEEVRELYEVRATLEGLACEKFTEHASDRDVERLQDAFDRLDKVAQANDHQKILAIKAEFYGIIFAGSKFAIVEELVASLMVRIAMLRRMSLASPGRNAAMMKEVRLILEAALARDAEAMKAACIAHVRSAMSAALSRVSNAAAEEESGASI